MRSIDRYRERYKKNPQSTKKPKNKTVDWDFVVDDSEKKPKFTITLDEANNESDIEKFERYIRQLSRCIYACSLCERGCNFFKYKNYVRAPHSPPSIWHKKVAFIKYEPDKSDINGLFEDNNLIKLLHEYDANLKNFYCTSIIKCAGNHETECSYFDLEWKAIQPCVPQLLIIFDKKSAEYFNIEYKIGAMQKLKNTKAICIGKDYEGLETILKILSNQQIRNRLIS